jgi:hypothetical protein
MLPVMVHSTEQVHADGLELAGWRSLRRLLHGVAALANGLDQRAVLPHILGTAVDLVDAQYGALGVYDRETGSCRPAVSRSVGRGFVEPATAPAAVHEVLRRTAHESRPLRDPHFVAQQPGRPDGPPQPPLSVLGVPILVRHEVFASVCLVEKRSGGGFGELDGELVATLAAASAPAIEVAWLLAGLRG